MMQEAVSDEGSQYACVTKDVSRVTEEVSSTYNYIQQTT